jgi:hypothetical protein
MLDPIRVRPSQIGYRATKIAALSGELDLKDAVGVLDP